MYLPCDEERYRELVSRHPAALSWAGAPVMRWRRNADGIVGPSPAPVGPHTIRHLFLCRSKLQPPTGAGCFLECRLSLFTIFLPAPFLWTDSENRVDLRREPRTVESKGKVGKPGSRKAVSSLMKTAPTACAHSPFTVTQPGNQSTSLPGLEEGSKKEKRLCPSKWAGGPPLYSGKSIGWKLGLLSSERAEKGGRKALWS